jgi:hypothetical protein
MRRQPCSPQKFAFEVLPHADSRNVKSDFKSGQLWLDFDAAVAHRCASIAGVNP